MYYALFEKAFRIELFISIFISPILLYVDIDIVKKSIIIFSWMLVLITEIINTAIEKTVDRVSNERHILSKQAKDLASASVFLAIINFLIITFILTFY